MKTFWACLIMSLALASSRGEDAMDAASAAAKPGERVVFEDTVAQVVEKENGTVFLNFGAPFPGEVLAVVVMKETRPRFPDIAGWMGKKVRVEGEVSDHEGHPRVILRERGQIEVLESQPPRSSE